MAPLQDDANWNGVILKSTNVCKSPKRLLYTHLNFNGFQYATEGERLLAQLLTGQGIPFTPNVSFFLEAPPNWKPKGRCIFVPDFIFDKLAYVWRDESGEQLLHGLEAKRAKSGSFSSRAKKKVKLLKEQCGINVKLLSEADIQHYCQIGALPMRLHEP